MRPRVLITAAVCAAAVMTTAGCGAVGDSGNEPVQLRVTDGGQEAFLDMGYDDLKIGLDYEGSHHSEDREQYVHDIGRAALVESQGWIDIKVVKEHSRAYILHRVASAFAQRGWPPPAASSA